MGRGVGDAVGAAIRFGHSFGVCLESTRHACEVLDMAASLCELVRWDNNRVDQSRCIRILGIARERFRYVVPFPGQRIRTAIIPPSIQLVDQKGNPFDLEDLKGDVVVITGVYALCYSTCPQILVRLGALYNDLDPADRERVKFVALTLNPEGETTELMNAFVTGYGFEYPQFRYLNGDPDHMRELLKQLQFSSFVNPETGLIDHVNLFLLLDRNGEIAYRLTLDARHSSWLTAALGELIDETRELDKALVVN